MLQELFVKWSRTPPTFDGRAALSTWLYRVTTNACLNRMRDEQNRVRLLDVHVRPNHPTVSAPKGELLHALKVELRKFDAEQAAAAVYAVMDGMTHDEIADVMGCSRRHVGNLLQRFRDHAAALHDTPGEENS